MKRLILAIIIIIGTGAASIIPITVQSQQNSLSLSQVANSFNAATVTTSNGTTFALPANASQITWQTSFASNPASITVQIQTSLDNTNWFVVATSSVVAGDGGTFYSSAKFIRCAITASSGGTGITCGLVAKNAPVAIVSGTTGNINSNRILVGDGTSGAPSYSFNSEPTLGFWRSATNSIKFQGGGGITTPRLSNTGDSQFGSSGSYLRVLMNGQWMFADNSLTFGSIVNVSALPTIASGFGTSPSITAGSTPLAGSVNVGTGGVATTGTINFNGAAFPSVPFCTYSDSTSNIVTRGTPTTSTLVLNATTPWLGSDIISWLCISSK